VKANINRGEGEIMAQPQLSLLIPTYNESDIIESALQAIAAELGPDAASKTEVIVVDDGTDDLPLKLGRISPALPFARVLLKRNSPGLGKGKSLAWGFENAEAPIVGFMDVDLSTPPSYIKKAVEAIQSDRADIFIGSRKANGAHVNREQFFLKDILGDVLGVIARTIIFQGMRRFEDTQCGFKFYKNPIAKTLYRDLVAPDGLNDIEVLIRANLMGYRVEECGVKWTDLRESKRSLKRILLGEMIAITRVLIKYKLFAAYQRRSLRRMAELSVPGSDR
jgi:dolichyl-phosphate beta-glucosyltransferase